MSRRVLFVVALLGSLLAGCGDAGVIAVRVQLEADLSGHVTARCLQVPDKGASVEAATTGVGWTQRVDLHCTRGAFADLSKVRIADLMFDAGKTRAGMSWLRVTFPRGDSAQWPTAMAPTREQRLDAERAFDPENKLSKPARTVTVAVTLPSPAVGHGASPRLRGVASSIEGRVATLVVPVDIGHDDGRPIIWDVTWR